MRHSALLSPTIMAAWLDGFNRQLRVLELLKIGREDVPTSVHRSLQFHASLCETNCDHCPHGIRVGAMETRSGETNL
jgi:hypothetical protein